MARSMGCEPKPLGKITGNHDGVSGNLVRSDLTGLEGRVSH
jgi:hypothetical protein